MSQGKMIHELPDEILVAIFSYLSVEDLALSIHNVCIRWRMVVQDTRLWRSLRYCPSKGMNKEDAIIRVLQGAPNLRWPMPWYLYSRKILEAICEYCKDVREIYIFEAENKLMSKLVRECPNIEYLELDYYKFETTRALDIVSKCNNLKHLKLSGYGSDSETKLFKALAEGAPSLESLDIQYLTHFASSDLVYFLKKKGHQMRSLVMHCCFYCENACIMPVITTNCTVLEALTLDSHGRYIFSPGSSIEILTDFFESNHGQKLKKLELWSIGSFDRKLSNAIFENSSNLQHVSFEKIRSLSDECLEPVYLLRYLTTLKCDYCVSITDKGVTHIVRCSSLKFLSLTGCENLTNKSFVLCCTELKMLEKLVLNVPTLELKDVYNVPKLLKNLKYLHISREGLEEKIPIYFKRVMPELNLFM